ncbi:MAG: sodium:calcium antiporter [Candidatus Aenigmatarchaeota archaeon]
MLIILGLFGLWFGSDIVVSGAQRIARRLKVSEVVIGLTVVSIGTSIPEISTNLAAGYNKMMGIDASGIAVGNIIGSCLSQITLVIGIVGFFATMYLKKRSLIRDGFMMMFALFVMLLASSDLIITQLEGFVLVSIYVIYIIYLIDKEKLFVQSKKVEGKKGAIVDVVKILLGAGIVVFAADLVVKNGVGIAQTIGIREALIGILVGLGTSLPELSVSLKGVFQGSGGISIGNLIGSNITDPLFSLGLGSLLAGFTVSSSTLFLEFPFWIIGTAMALLLLHNHTNLNRNESLVLIIFYVFFLYFQFFIF